jgi:transducin (beta)-like 1
VFGPNHGPKFSVPAEEPRRSSVRETSRIPNYSERETPNGGSVEPTGVRPKKGKRKSAGSDRRMNGEMMDVDVGGMGQTSMADPTVAEAESPLPVIEEPIIPTLSIGHSQEISTEAPRDLNLDTSFLPPNKDTTLEFVKWCPDNSTALLVAGQNHMRAYRISSEVPGDQSESKYSNIPVDEEDYRVQAFCWTERSSALFSTAREHTNEEGGSIPQNRLFGFTDYGNGMRLVDPVAGTIVALHYNPSSNLILCISHGEQAVIKIWHYSQTEPEGARKRKEANFEFKLDKTVGKEIYDAAWTTDNKFIVCGMSTLELYEVGEDITSVKSFHTEQDWFRMKYDPLCEVAALSDDEMHALGVVKLDGDLKIHNETFQNTTLTDFAFQPIPNKESYKESSPRLLATSSANGQVRIWNALGPLICLHELSLGMQATAQVVSFSPDGFLLAAAGYDTLRVWKTDEGGEPKAVWHMPAPNDRWESVPLEEPDEKEPLAWLHTLSWDSDGKKLAFGLRDQVAVIRLRQAESVDR